MRYYHYLSTAKVEMLYGQLGLGPVGSKTELGVDFKVAKATRSTERSGEVNVYEKLSAVEEWIYVTEPVGSIEEPDAWLSGRHELFAFTHPGNWHRKEAPPIVYSARTASGSLLVLGGSSGHLATQQATASVPEMDRWVTSEAIGLQRALWESMAPAERDTTASSNDYAIDDLVAAIEGTLGGQLPPPGLSLGRASFWPSASTVINVREHKDGSVSGPRYTSR